MNNLLVLVTSSALIALPSVALAGELSFAAPEGCPDARAFSEAVSARAGIPTLEIAGADLVVRIAIPQPDERIGTLEWGDKTHLARGSSCAEVFDDLVTAATRWLEPQPPPTLAPMPPASTGTVEVTVESTKPGLTVALTSRGLDEKCFSPCTFELPTGLHEISTYGKGTRTVRLKMAFEQPEVRLESRPISWAGFIAGTGLAGAGSTAMLLGAATLWGLGPPTCRFNDNCESVSLRGGVMLGGGALAVGGGIPLMLHNGKIVVVEPR